MSEQPNAIPLAKMSDINAHTPAPWAAVRSNPAEGADVWWIVGNLDAHNREKDIGSVQGGCSPSHEADAQLIAAAPDLLAFVKSIARIDPVFAKGAQKQRIAEARSLVAKATTPAEAI